MGPRGQRDAPFMAGLLAPLLQDVSYVACSPSLRTRKTLEPLLPLLQQPEVEYPEALYEAHAEDLQDWLRRRSTDARPLLIVGHEGGLSELARRLCPAFTANKLPTAGCLGLALPLNDWRELHGACAELLFWEYPKRHLPPMEDPLECGRA